MGIIELIFLLLFSIGILLIIGPMIGQLIVFLSIFKRNRFYDKRRLHGRVDSQQKENRINSHPFIRQVEESLSVAEIKMSLNTMLSICLAIAFITFLLCYRIMPSPINNALVASLFGCFPLLWAWSKFQRKTLSMSSVMIPAVQNFIGYFTEADNLEGAIYKSARTAPLEIASEWNRLIMDLQTGEPPDVSIIQFAERVGNDWAHYFADILITHLETGVDITPSLFKLINEMQNAVYNEEKRITMLQAYKWGTFMMVGLSVFVVYYNIQIDPKNKFYYFEDPSGIRIVSLSILILFSSFVGAMNMGRKKL